MTVGLAVAVLSGLALAGSRVSVEDAAGLIAAAALGTTFVEVIGNVLDGNAGRGAGFDEASSGSVRDTTVRGSAVGIEIAPGASPRLGDNVFEDVGEAAVIHGEP